MYQVRGIFIIVSLFVMDSTILPAQSPAPAPIQTVLSRLLPVVGISKDSVRIEMFADDEMYIGIEKVASDSESYYLMKMGTPFFLSDARDEATLAGFLTHELAHLKLRHVDLSREEYNLRYPAYEKTADSLAIVLLVSAGYDPKGFVGFLSRFGIDCAKALVNSPDASEDRQADWRQCATEMPPRAIAAKIVAKELKAQSRLSMKSEEFKGFRNTLAKEYLLSAISRARPSTMSMRHPH